METDINKCVYSPLTFFELTKIAQDPKICSRVNIVIDTPAAIFRFRLTPLPRIVCTAY